MIKSTLSPKTKIKTSLSLIFIVCALIAVGCAPASSSDGEWASGEPDVPAFTPETPQTTTPLPEEETPEVPALPGLYFSFDPGTSRLANGPGKTWDGCEKSAIVRGGYDSDTKCGNGLVHPNYAEHLNRHFFGCVERAAADANYKQPERVFIRHWGTYVNRNARGSTSLSMHAYARAIDVVKFILYDRNGGTTQVSTHVRDFKGATAKFYNSFRQCWKESMPSACRPGQREYSGSIGIPGSALGGNSLHNDHIHLSFPFCAG
ncbi:extensin family protein [Bdellovibrio bacteriovorus]|uniref:extensin family protein n=1 Tax=Bdellovibrio bacteriovorus TaxID=959 RepID=UPI0035A8254D